MGGAADVAKGVIGGIGSAVGGIVGGGGQDQPDPPEPTPPPKREDPEVRDQARRRAGASRQARGRGSTILTSELGVTDNDQSRRRTLGSGNL